MRNAGRNGCISRNRVTQNYHALSAVTVFTGTVSVKDMTIQELIAELSQYDPDIPVVVRGYEGGYNDVSLIEPKSMQLNVNDSTRVEVILTPLKGFHGGVSLDRRKS